LYILYAARSCDPSKLASPFSAMTEIQRIVFGTDDPFGISVYLSKNMVSKNMDYLFRPLDKLEAKILKKFKKEVNDKSVLDVLDSKVPLPAAFIDFTILLIQQNVQSTRLIGSHKITEEILKLDRFESQHLKVDWTKEHEVILLFHAVDKQWITFWADLNQEWITAFDWQDRKAGDMSEDIKNDAINKISVVLTRMAKMSKKELTLEVKTMANNYPRPSDSDSFVMAAIAAYAVACGLDPFKYIESVKQEIGDRDLVRERILFEYLKQNSPNVAVFIESKRKESEDNSGDEHGPKLKRRKVPNYSQCPLITQQTSVDQKRWVNLSFDCDPNVLFIGSQFTLEHYKTLMNNRWLGDDVINKFFKMLEKRDAAMQKNGDLDRRSFFCQTSFLYLLRKCGPSSVAAVTKKMVNVDKIYVPVHISDCHWALVMVSMQEKQIEYYDSLGMNGGNSHMQIMISYLCQRESNRGYELVPEDWTMKTAEVPKQKNGTVQGAGVQIIAS
jgi:hypothetical protein